MQNWNRAPLDEKVVVITVVLYAICILTIVIFPGEESIQKTGKQPKLGGDEDDSGNDPENEYPSEPRYPQSYPPGDQQPNLPNWPEGDQPPMRPGGYYPDEPRIPSGGDQYPPRAPGVPTERDRYLSQIFEKKFGPNFLNFITSTIFSTCKPPNLSKNCMQLQRLNFLIMTFA